MTLQLDGPPGTLAGRPVRFCTVCCRFNPLPGSLCPTCRDTRRQQVVAPALSISLRRRFRYVAKILVSFLVLALVASAVIAGTGGALLAVGFYITISAIVLAIGRSVSRRSKCKECGSYGANTPSPVEASPGVPLVVGADHLRCASCGALAASPTS